MVRKREGRPARKRMSEVVKLEIPSQYIEKGYVHRIVNDEPGRLDRFTEAGWEFIHRHNSQDHDGLGSVLDYFTGVTLTNQEGKSYAMRIKEDWYNEDQAAKQKEGPDLVDESVRRGVESVPHAYTPGQPAAEVVRSPVTIK